MVYERIGIRPERAARFVKDGEGIKRNYSSINRSMSFMKHLIILDDDILSEVKEDYETRGK